MTLLNRRGLGPRTSRLASALAAVAIAVAAISLAVPSAAASAPWPSTWTPYTFIDGSSVRDVGGDNNPSYADVWSGDPSAQGPIPTTYFATDGTNIFFRIRVADDPETNRGGSFQSNVWLVQIAVGGVHQASVGLDGKPAGVNDTVYVSDAAGTTTTTVYAPVVPDGSASGGGRVVADGAGGYLVDFQVPISEITAVAPTVTPSAPVQLFFGTSTNNSNINKDYMTGDGVSFVGLSTVALDGTPVGDTSTEVAITSPGLTNDSTPTISGTGEAGATIELVVDGQTLTTTVAADGTWSVTVPVGLADATHSVEVTATDAAGNTATATQPLTVDTATTVAITSATLTTDPTPTISGTGEPGSTVSLTIDGQVLSGVVDATGSWSISVPAALADGTYTVTTTATDLAGNTASATQELTVDTGTSVAVTSAPLTSDPGPVISGVGEPGATIQVEVGGETLTTTVALDGTWSVDVVGPLPDGANAVLVTATDALGNTATTTQSLMVDTSTSVTLTPPGTTDDPTPTLSGTGEPGSTIELVVDGQTLTGVVDGSGSWSITIPVALADGSYSVSVTATDLAGNVATDTQPLTVDTQTAVAVTSAPLTTDPTPLIGGTGEPGAAITVVIDGQTLTTTVAGDGTWSVAVPVALADSTYPVSVTAVDALGNTATDTQNLTVDTTTTVAITSPTLTDSPTPTISGTGEPGSTVEVTVDGQVLSTTVDASGVWSVDVPVALADSTYPVSVTATDLAGNTATDTQNLTVDTTTTVAITSASLTTDPTPTISGTAEPGATVEVTVDGQVLTTTVAGDGSWSVDVPVALADSTYPVSVTATDLAGNTATDTQPLTVDTTTSVAITGPASTTDPTPTISGTAEPGSTVEVTVDGQTLTTTVDASGVWSVDVPVALADGSYPVSVTATDLAGNVATDTQPLTVDTTTFVAVMSPPLTTDSTPTISGTGEPGSTVEVTVDGQTLTTTVAGDGTWSVGVPVALADSTYPVSVTATDGLGNTASTVQNLTVDTTTSVAITSPDVTDNPTPTFSGTGEPGSTIEVTVDGQTLTATVDGSGTWSVAVPVALADGIHAVSVTATDLAGNTATTSQDLTVDAGTFVAVTSSPLTNDSTPTISGTGEPGATIEVTVDGQTLTTTVAGDGSWSVDVPAALADGTYPVSVTATDGSGNTASTVQNLTVDTTTSVAITSPDATDNPTPTISGTGEPGATIEVTVDGQTLTTTVDASGVWSVPVPVALADGTHGVSVTATDLAGNTASDTQSLTVDTSTSVAVTSDSLTDDSTPTISGTGEPGSTVEVLVGGQTLTTTVAGDGTWSVDVPVALADGIYAVSVTATDWLGNTASTLHGLTVDTTTSVDITSPTITDDSTPTISGTGEPGATVEVTVDGQTLVATVAGDGTWSVDVPVALADGAFPVSVTATDEAGNTATDVQSLTVDTSTSVDVTSATITDDSTPTISGTGEPGATVEVTVDGQTLVATVAGDGTWSVDVPVALADSTYLVSVTATDAAGNTATDVQPLTVDTSTSVAITSDPSTETATPTISGTGEPGSTVEVTVDGQTLTTTVAGDGSWSVDVPVALPDGDHPVSVTTTDAAGNTATDSQNLTVDTSTSVDITGPTITNNSTPTISGTGEPGATIEVTVDGQTLTTTVAGDGSWSVDVPVALADGTFPVSVTATDALGNVDTVAGTLEVDTSTEVDIVGPGTTNDPTPTISGTGEPGATVEVTVDGQTLTATVDAAGVWSVDVPVALADGTYPVSVTATDAAGNTASTTQDLHVDSSIESSITSPDATGDSTPTISGSGEPGATVEVTVDGQTLTTTVDASGVWSVDVPVALDDGAYPVSVTSADDSGNTVTTVQQLTVDTMATVTPTSPTLTNDPTPVIAGTGTPGDTVTVMVGGHTLVTTVGDDGEWAVSVPTELDDGAHAVEVTTEDPLGNVGSTEFTLVIDTVAEADTNPASNGQISGTAEPGSSVTVTVGGTTTTVVVGSDGIWSVPLPQGLPAGDLVVTVATVDMAGNTSVESLTAAAPQGSPSAAAPQPSPTAGATQSLPNTGSAISGLVSTGLVLAVAGAFLVLVGSRPRRQSHD